MTAPFTEERAKVKYVLIDGLKFEIKPEDAARTKVTGGAAAPTAWHRRRTGRRRGRRPRWPDAVRPDDEDVLRAGRKENRAGPRPSKRQSKSPQARAPTTRTPAPPRAAATQPADQERSEHARQGRGFQDCRIPKSRMPSPNPKPTRRNRNRRLPKQKAAKPAAAPFVDVATELDDDRKPSIHTGGNVFIKGATILTVTKGTIAKGSILIKDGKIKAVGTGLTAPAGVTVIDAAGLVAMPGIIDTHSHIAVQGGVNEGTLSVVPEVRVKDVVTGDDIAIYRALAGGTTTARLLHGSANTIGGQDAVVKLRYGKPGRDLIIREGPQGVKFALGENVTRSRGRFPNTRMGVESVIERAFDEARAYRATWDDYRKAEKNERRRQARPAAPRRPASRSAGGDPRRLDQDPQPLLPQRRDLDAACARPRNTACASSRSSTCWKATRSPPRSPRTGPARPRFPTGGPTRSRPTTRFLITPPC